MQTMPEQFQHWLQQASACHIRLPVIWQGEQTTLLEQTGQIVQQNKFSKVYWLGADAPTQVLDISKKAPYQILGSECDALIINAFSGLDADLLAAASGCIKAGGLWLLLCPPFENWQHSANPASQKVLPYPLVAESHKGQFLPFWLNQLQQQNLVIIQHQQVSQTLAWPDFTAAQSVVAPYVTAEQQQAVAAILHVVSGHRRRPLVLTANRGRGKSAAMGIAAAQLAAAGKHILLTAPSPSAADTALSHFQALASPDRAHQLSFVPFDELLRSDLKADLLLVDEAAAIPTPVLQQLLQRYSRIVFATTEHGYEGTGRGFQLRFQQYLTEQCPNWRKLHITQPVRYQQHDPLEQLIFNSLLLRHDTVIKPSLLSDKPIEVIRLCYADWANHTDLLEQVFCLLSFAHYQTQIKDLVALLDNPKLSVVALLQERLVLACALVSEEGELDSDLARQIYRSERRVQGHLLAQSLAFHLAQPELATKKLWRVMRITVQPELQRQALGTTLLRHIDNLAHQHNVDVLGTSYGVTASLLAFWHQNSYRSVRLGHSVDKASSEYSLLMLKAVNAAQQQVDVLAHQFSQLLYHSLMLYPLLPAELALELCQPENSAALSLAELEQLQLFAENKRPYELVQHLLLRWFNCNLAKIAPAERALFAALFWQKADWDTLSQQLSLPGKKAVVRKLIDVLNKSSIS